MNKKAIIEGLLFVVGDEGLTINQIEDILNIDILEAKKLISEMMEYYNSDDRGIKLNFLGNTVKFTTNKEHCQFYQKLVESPYSNNLSQAALETLAIIAYNQPITRIQVDEIRGVCTSQIIRKLSAKGLIKEIGRSELPGRPILYNTTNEFLDYFGINNLNQLPKINKNDTIDEEIDLFKSKYEEITNEG